MDDAQFIKKYGRNAMLGSFAGQLTAGLAVMMYSVCLGLIRQELGFTGVQAGTLGTWTILGQLFGGMIAGYVADKIGRVKILWLDLFMGTTGMFAVSFARDFNTIAILRFYTGFGLGGCYYLATVLVGEFSPTEKRAFNSAISVNLWNFGYVVANAVAAIGIISSIGWRMSFRWSALPIVMLAWMVFNMKDPLSFTAARAARLKRAKETGVKEKPYAEIWSRPNLRKNFIIWSISMNLYFFGFYGFLTWLPSYVQSRVGFVTSGWITAATYIAMIIGAFIGGWSADKFGRKKTFIAGTVGTAIFGLAMSAMAHADTLLPMLLLYGVCYGAPTALHSTFIGESFPTGLRATAVGFTFNIGRIGAAIAPIVIGKFVDMNMIAVGIGSMTISYILCSLVTLPIKEKEYDAAKITSNLQEA
jgi:AAHS family cis,cis-muconate transporter-like MFS transporter